MAAAQGHNHGVDTRHDEATGVSHEDSVHHFTLAPDGGSIRLEITGGGRREDRDRIRQHLKHIARSFADGDFSLPMFIHDRTPPGVDVLKARRQAIRYEYSATRKGGQVRLSTQDPEALAAIHAFLRFQIHDHATGDPTSFD